MTGVFRKWGAVEILLAAVVLAAVTVRIGLVLFKPPILADIAARRQAALVEQTGISAKTIELARRGDLVQSDAAIYHRLAADMAAGNGVSEATAAPFGPTRVRTPGYPFLLAIVYAVAGPEFKAALVLQSLLGGLTALLAFAITRRLSASPHAGLLAAAIVAFYPALIYYDTRLLRESLIGFLLTFMVWWTLRPESSGRRGLIVSGACVAWLSTTKPEMLLLGLPVFLWHTWPLVGMRARVRTAALIALPVALVWVPWTARNLAYFGSPSPVTLGVGSVVWFGNRWADIGGEDRKREDQWELRAEAHEIIHGNRENGETRAESEFAERAAEDVLSRPLWFASMTLRKAWMFWEDANGIRKTLPALHPALPGLVNGAYYALLAFAVLGAVSRCRTSARARYVLFTILTFAATYALLHVRNRYRVPILPLVFTFSGVGLHCAWHTVRSRISTASPRSAPAAREAAGAHLSLPDGVPTTRP